MESGHRDFLHDSGISHGKFLSHCYCRDQIYNPLQWWLCVPALREGNHGISQDWHLRYHTKCYLLLTWWCASLFSAHSLDWKMKSEQKRTCGRKGSDGLHHWRGLVAHPLFPFQPREWRSSGDRWAGWGEQPPPICWLAQVDLSWPEFNAVQCNLEPSFEGYFFVHNSGKTSKEDSMQCPTTKAK